MLVRWSRRSASAQDLAQRCRIVLGCADGKTGQEVAAGLGIWPVLPSASGGAACWRRLEGLADEPRPGAPGTIGDEQTGAVVVARLERTPENAARWSRTSMIQHIEYQVRPAWDQSLKGTTRTWTVLPSVDSRSASPSRNCPSASGSCLRAFERRVSPDTQ